MENKQLEWSERALNDYENLAEFLYNHWGENVALSVLLDIDAQLNRIENTPEQFPVFLKTKEIRRCVASPQTSIFFVVKPTSIFILSIFDNRQSPGNYPK